MQIHVVRNEAGVDEWTIVELQGSLEASGHSLDGKILGKITKSLETRPVDYFRSFRESVLAKGHERGDFDHRQPLARGEIHATRKTASGRENFF